jgi:hypothetical protein
VIVVSYIKSPNTYAYPDGNGGMILHSNQTIDQASSDIGSGGRHRDTGRVYRWMTVVSPEEFRELVSEILTRTAPEWVKPAMVEKAVERFIAGEKVV